MSIARSSFFFAAGTLLSRVSGLVRDMVVAHILGAGPLHDAFVVAQRIPNLLRDMLAEGAMGSSFTKIYTTLKEQDPLAAEKLLFQMLYLCFLVMIGLVCLGIWAAPQLVNIMVLGATTSEIFERNAVTLTRILFPSLGMSVLGAIAMGALYQKGRFFFNAIIPVLANLGVIAGGLFLGDWLFRAFPSAGLTIGDAHVQGLAWGTIIGFLVQMLAAMWSVRRHLQDGARSLWNVRPWSRDISQVLVLMGPAIIATSAAPINSIINTNFATGVGPGAVTWLTYAFRILQLPIGIFGVAVGVYALPALTRSVVRAGKKIDAVVSAQLQQACLFVSWLLIPCMIFTLVNHFDIIELLLHHGKYLEKDVRATGDALFAYAFSMLAYGLIKVMTAFYYATDRTTYAMKVSLVSIVINLLGNWLLVERWGHVGLALTASLTLSINALLLLWGSHRMGVSWEMPVIRRHAVCLFIACGSFLILSLLNRGAFHYINAWTQPLGTLVKALFEVLPFQMETWADRAVQQLAEFLLLAYNGILVVAIFSLFSLLAYRRGLDELLRKLQRVKK